MTTRRLGEGERFIVLVFLYACMTKARTRVSSSIRLP